MARFHYFDAMDAMKDTEVPLGVESTAFTPVTALGDQLPAERVPTSAPQTTSLWGLQLLPSSVASITAEVFVHFFPRKVGLPLLVLKLYPIS